MDHFTMAIHVPQVLYRPGQILIQIQRLKKDVDGEEQELGLGDVKGRVSSATQTQPPTTTHSI